jgi:hypothetical protein
MDQTCCTSINSSHNLLDFGQSKIEPPEYRHRALRGNSHTTSAVSPVEESLANAHSRMLGVYTGSKANLAVQSGAGIIFTYPPTTIK